MGWEAWVTLAIVAAVLYALARNIAPPDLVLLAGAVAVTTFSAASSRFPTPSDLAAAFGNEGLLTVGALFVVTAGLTETGALSLVTERLLGRPRSTTEAQLRLMVPVATISAFLNNTPVVAMFMPVVHEWCKRTHLRPSRLFIPLSYAAVLGGV
jgi:Na+/H+ antiporter NhaD/arsenite permease-like protein